MKSFTRIFKLKKLLILAVVFIGIGSFLQINPTKIEIKAANDITITKLLSTNQATYYNTNSGSTAGTYVSAWSMAAKGNKLFLGWSKNVPDYNNSNTFLSYYDSGTGLFTKIMDIPEQDVTRMKVFGNKLYLPGNDPTAQGWDADDLFIIDTTSLAINQLTYRYPSNHFVDATTTDSSGNYSFTGLKNTAYVIKVIKPANYIFSTPFVNSGNFNAIDSNINTTTALYTQCNGNGSASGAPDAGVRFGEPYTDSAIDAGLRFSSGAAAGTTTSGTVDNSFHGGDVTLGDFVWNDTNSDGKQTGGEVGMAGVRVELYTRDPYFPCGIHSQGIYVDDDDSIYMDYGYLRKPDTVTISGTTTNRWGAANADLLVRSTDAGVTWNVVDNKNYKDLTQRLSPTYFASDLIKNNGYFYRNPTLQGGSSSDGNFHQDSDGNFVGTIPYDYNWNYSTNGSDWTLNIIRNTDFIEGTPSGGFKVNYYPNLGTQYSRIIKYRDGVLIPATKNNEIIKFIGANYTRIPTNVSTFGDILPSYAAALNPTGSDDITGGGQRFNAIESVNGEYIYQIGADNKLYVTSDLRNWIAVADFSIVDSGAQMGSLEYWSDKHLLVISTIGSGGSIYTIDHNEVASRYFGKILNTAGLAFYDNNEPTVDLKIVGTTNGITPTLIKKGSLLLSDVNVTFGTSDLNWNSVDGDTTSTLGKSFVKNITTAPGAAATHSLYIPIPTGNSGERVLICPDAQSLTSVDYKCSNGVYFTNGETKSVGGVNVTVSKATVNGQLYWIASGVNGTGGLAVIPDTAAPTGTLKINDGDAVTEDVNLTLTITALDNQDISNQLQMEISAKPDFGDSTWQNFSSQKSMVAGAFNGLHVLYLRFKDSSGNVSGAYSASITFVNQPFDSESEAEEPQSYPEITGELPPDYVNPSQNNNDSGSQGPQQAEDSNIATNSIVIILLIIGILIASGVIVYLVKRRKDSQSNF